MATRYAHLLNPAFLSHIADSRLSELITTTAVLGADDHDAIDWQIFVNCHLNAHHGHLRLLTITHNEAADSFTVRGHYSCSNATGYGDLMRCHTADNIEPMVNLIETYLQSAVGLADARYYRNRTLGYWQNRISRRFGGGFRQGDTWFVIDSIPDIMFDDYWLERNTFIFPILAPYQAVKDQLQQTDPATWGGDRKPIHHWCNLLAFSREGQLLCIKHKHGSNANDIPWGGLQAAACRDLFAATIDSIWPGICALVRQKVALKLLPEEVLRILQGTSLPEMKAMFIVSEPNPSTDCWVRLREVSALCPEAACHFIEVAETNEQLQLQVR